MQSKYIMKSKTATYDLHSTITLAVVPNPIMTFCAHVAEAVVQMYYSSCVDWNLLWLRERVSLARVVEKRRKERREMNSQVNVTISVWFLGLREEQFGMTPPQCAWQPCFKTLLFFFHLILLQFSCFSLSFSPFFPPSPSFSLAAPPEEDEDNEDLSDMEEGDANASAAKQMSRRQQVYCLASCVEISKLQGMILYWKLPSVLIV